MVVQTLKKILLNSSNSFPSEFKKMLKNFSDDYQLDEDSINVLYKAYLFGDEAHRNQKRNSGEKYFSHCIEVCNQLIRWNMDLDTIIAGLLHDTIEDTDATKDVLIEEFGYSVAILVERVSKLSGIRFRDSKHKQTENFMKMFLSVSKDLRVIIIKFSDRLHNVKTLKYLPEIKQERIAIETRDLYAPLAHRLGMNQLKMEFEDITFKILDKKNYSKIERKVKSTNKQRNKYIENFVKSINKQLVDLNIDAEVFGRAKHYYSIYNKMNKRTLSFNELYDLLAIRIIVNKVEECYSVLGVIHQLFTPIQKKFKDYIATPKSNGYQSIHTTIFTEDGEMMEIQIRTKKLDQLAEIGIAAHWRYKENNSKSKTQEIDKHVKWLRELVDNLQSENRGSNEMLELLKIDLFQDEIFVFTPNGDVHQLKANSTPIDFAFSIHSQVGFNCNGAKVNSKIVPLNTELKNGDKVEILTSDKHKPNQAWLKIVKTTKAKTHIKRFLKKEEEEKSIELGQEILEKTLRRIKKINLVKEIIDKPEKLGFNNVNAIYSEIAKGKITIRNIIEKYDDVVIDESSFDLDNDSITQKFINRARGIARGVKVGGISNTLIYFPKCCSPIPGDEIIGYITRGKGVTIHRNNCKNVKFEKVKDRFIEVEWEVNKESAYLVRLKITFEDRKHLLKDLTESTSYLDINIKSVDIKAVDGLAVCLMIVEVSNSKQLQKLKNAIKKAVNPMSLERV